MDKNVKVITFPAHTSGKLQVLDWVFFGVFKQVNRRLPKDSTLLIMSDHARCMFMAVESAGVSSTIQGSFQR
jgi:hypothetical protein